MTPDISSIRPDIAACGLYGASCRQCVHGKCPGCRDNAKAHWCKIRPCCTDTHYSSCADCALMPPESCKKFDNSIAKIFAWVFRTDSPACILRIREIGHDGYAAEMHASGRLTVRK